MEKLNICPACGRMNPPANLVCSNCGIVLSTKKEFAISKGKTKEEIGSLPFFKQSQKLSWETLRPSETKIFLFVSLIFTTLFLHLTVKSKIIFSIFFYPSLYMFSCYWVSKKKISWKSFLSELFLLTLLFFIVFSIL